MGASNFRGTLPLFKAKDCTLNFSEENEFASFIKKAEYNPESFLETIMTYFQTHNIWRKTPTGRPYVQIICSTMTNKILCNKFVAEMIRQYGLKSLMKFGFEEEASFIRLVIIKDDVVTFELLINKGTISNIENFGTFNKILTSDAVKCFKSTITQKRVNIHSKKPLELLEMIISRHATDCFRAAIDSGLMETIFEENKSPDTCVLRESFVKKFFSVQFLEICYQKKVSFNVKDSDGRNILHFIAQYSRYYSRVNIPYEYTHAMIKYAIAGLNARDFSGDVPLMVAVKSGSPSLIQALLDSKANTMILDGAGKCIFQRALRNGNPFDVSNESWTKAVNVVDKNLRKHGEERRFTLAILKNYEPDSAKLSEVIQAISTLSVKQNEAILRLSSHFLTSVDYNALKKVEGPHSPKEGLIKLREELIFWITINLVKRSEGVRKFNRYYIRSIVEFLIPFDSDSAVVEGVKFEQNDNNGSRPLFKKL